MWHAWESIFVHTFRLDLDIERKVQCSGGLYGYLQTVYVADRSGRVAERLNDRYS